MKGTVKARATWDALDRPGGDTCRLIAEPDGWMLVGHAWFRDDGIDARLDYVVRCDRDWLSHSADVTGTVSGEAVGWRLCRDAEGWRLNGASVANSAGCHDVDLGFTPATNLLPVRRLGLQDGVAHRAEAVWLRVPEGRAEVLRQSYEREDHRHVRYRSPGYETRLEMHPSGFVTHYPDGWRGDVDAG